MENSNRSLFVLSKNDSNEFETLRFAISSSEDGIWEYHIASNQTFVSKRWLEIIGYTEEEYQSSVETWKELLHPDDRERALAVLNDSIANKVESAHVVYRVRHKNGHYLWIKDRAKILFGPHGEPQIVAGFRTDITQRMALEQHNKELAAIIQNTSVEVYIIDTETLHYLYANEGALKAIGYTLEELEKLTITDINPDISPEHIETFRQYLNTISPQLSNLSRHRRKNGTFYPVQANVHKLEYHGRPAVVIFDTDISELSSTQEQLIYQSTHDALSGLPNRVLFKDRLEMALKKIDTNEKLAVIFLDLDHFKQINDSLGHQIGDQILVEATQRIQSIVKECDTVARMGGDEFNILIDSITNTDALIETIEKLLQVFQEPFIQGSRMLYSTISIGITISPDDGDNVTTLLKNADTAMYRAKNEGRNTYRFYADEMGNKAYTRVIMENALRIALKENQFAVYYQPQVDLSTGQWIGMEALVRWIHPTLGIISPVSFIPICEESGLIQDVDLFVLESVITQHLAWREMGLIAPKTAVNLSAKTLESKTITKEIWAILEFYHSPHEMIAIEVTESQIMNNPDEAIQILNEFKKLGLEISVDDFGTGYSSLSYLKRLPIDKLKIDQSFIRDIPHDEEDMAITTTIIGLAKNLKLDVIAEGVETAEQKDFLIENGCLLAQGYYFSRPINAEEITQMLMEYSG